MIYLDVTSACRSALNTGVKRIQRGLHGFLVDRPDYQPISWDSRRRCYLHLDYEDLALLLQKRTPSGLDLFDSFAPGAWKDWTRFLRPPSRATLTSRHPGLVEGSDASSRQTQQNRTHLAAPLKFQPGDLLLLPDLLWDNRARFLPAVPGLRRIAVFHDAIALHRPIQSRLDALFCRRAMIALAALDGVLCVSREAESDLHAFWREHAISPTPDHGRALARAFFG